MEKPVAGLYGVLAGILLALLCVIGVTFRYSLDRERIDPPIETMTPEEDSVQDADAPLGMHMEYSFQVPEIANGRQELVFYTIHQNVEIWLEDTVIYRFFADEGNAFGRTAGRVWNFISLMERDEGKELKVVITSPYEATLKAAPVFYFGEKSEILGKEVKRSIFPLCVGSITFLAGAALLCFVFYTRLNKQTDKSLFYLGIFAMEIALWQIFDLPAVSVLFPYELFTAYIPLVMLMLIPVPFILFVRQLHTSREHIIWKIMCILSFLNMGINAALQVTDLADFRETLILTHLTFLLVIVLGIYMMIREWRKVGLSAKLKLNIIFMTACVLGTAVDMALYYITTGSSIMICGLLGFLLYVVVLGVVSIVDVRHLMDIGKEAEKYEKMAYHDQLTGLLNRLSWVELIRKEDFRPEEYMVIMLDLNDLKQCNDSLGHTMGDRYIRESAKLIAEAFGSRGICFRLGGDEFSVLFHSTSEEECRACIEMMQRLIEEKNAKEPAFKMQIAYGYACFDATQDNDMDDTKGRADAAMYRRKFAMKRQSE